ncbi:MAG TPA: TldD/PmbA family protein [Actinomycetota bacterium]|nr:TldD/PmbA family protein [Actinomycetota bacterium]
MSELLELARAVAADARGDEQVEAFLTHDKTFQVRAFGGEVESLSSAEPRGIGVRVVADSKVGFSYSTDLSVEGCRVVLERARQNASFASADEAVGLAAPAPTTEIPDLVDERFSSVTAEERARFAVALDAATKAADARVRTVEDAVYADSSSEVAIATSTGIADSYARSDAWCYSVAIASDGGDTEVGFEFDLGRSLRDLDPEDVGRRSAARAVSVLGAKKIPSARMPVVFDPYTAGQFLGVIGSALTGEAVQKGRSLFAGKVGDAVAGSLTLVDDGTIAGAPGSSPWDDEGTPTQRTELIADGVLATFLYDLVSARRDGVASTGNATRSGFKSAPRVAPSNLAFASTGESRAELLQRAGDAFLVQDFHGVHSGANPVSGDFSVGATGRVLSGGELGRPVKEVTIAAPMLDILAGIVAVADDRRWLPFGGSLGGATTLVREMTVAGL